VSKKNRTRRAASGQQAQARRQAGTTAVDRTLNGLWQAVAAGDPLAAELAAAECLALPRLAELDDEQGEEFITQVLVNQASQQASPEGAAVLRLLAALGSRVIKNEARAGLADLTGRGVYPQAWVSEVGKPDAVRAWRRYSVFGDHEAIAITFRYGEAEHGLLIQVDRAGMPLVTRVSVATDPDALTELITKTGTFEGSEEISLAEARQRLAQPVGEGVADTQLTTNVPAESVIFLPLARSRMRRLPEPADAPRFGPADRAAAVQDFLASPLAAEAIAADADSARFWAEVLTAYSGRVPDEPPGQVGPRKLAFILLGHVPASYDLTPAQRQHLEQTVTAWVRWSAAQRGLGEAETTELTEAVTGMLGDFDDAYATPDIAFNRAYLRDLAASDTDPATLNAHLTRRWFAVPWPGSASTAGDVGDPATRRRLVQEEFGDCTPPTGMTSDELVSAAQRVVEEIWSGDPAGRYATAEQLMRDGHDRHEIIHRLVQDTQLAQPRS